MEIKCRNLSIEVCPKLSSTKGINSKIIFLNEIIFFKDLFLNGVIFLSRNSDHLNKEQ